MNESHTIDRSPPAMALGDGPSGSAVTRPAKLIRLMHVARSMLEEARQAGCDAAGCDRLRAIYQNTITELADVLSDDLRDELGHLVVPFEDPQPTQADLRIAQAELVGWIEGLLSGIVVSVQSQQVESGAQIDPARGPTTPDEDRLPGQYL